MKNVANSATFYAVRAGRNPGVFKTWAEAKAQIEGFPKPDYKKFANLEDATRYYKCANLMYERREGAMTGNAATWAPRPLPEVFSQHHQSLWIFTDGSCRKKSTESGSLWTSGWGFVVLKVKNMDECSTIPGSVEVVHEACGGVVLSPYANQFLGATRDSNNTGELTAIGEALRWLLHVQSRGDCNSSNSRSPSDGENDISGLPVVISCDSTYAVNSVLGVLNGEKNVELISSIREMYERTLVLVSDAVSGAELPVVPGLIFAHVKGHSKHPWNDRADELANEGALSDCQNPESDV